MPDDKHIGKSPPQNKHLQEFHILSSQEKLFHIAGEQLGKTRDAQEKITSLLLLNKLEMQCTLVLIYTTSHNKIPLDKARIAGLQESVQEVAKHFSGEDMSHIQDNIASISQSDSGSKQSLLLHDILDAVRSLKSSVIQSPSKEA